MPYFILTDSDWNWDDAEGERGEYGPVIVAADNEQEATLLACEKMKAAGDDFDGAHFKIARVETHAFVGVETLGDGTFQIDPIDFIASGNDIQNGRPDNG